MKKIFTKYNDPGHGWVKVPYSLLVELEIQDKITTCSYQRYEFVYLEEDCDVTTFFDAYKNKYGVNPMFKNQHSNKQSKIRSYYDYQPEKAAAIANMRKR